MVVYSKGGMPMGIKETNVEYEEKLFYKKLLKGLIIASFILIGLVGFGRLLGVF